MINNLDSNSPASSILKFKTGNLKIDVVLQATGLHGWNASHGWVNVLRREGLLNRVFVPRSEWGAQEPTDDDGLFEYLEKPQADIMLLLGFDWHSQPLHNTLKWQNRWRNSSITKIATLIECYSADIVQMNASWKKAMSDAIDSTIPCVDALICHHEPDVNFLKTTKNIETPILFFLLGIDKEYYGKNKSFRNKENRAFFRGNINPYYEDRTYAARRKIIEKLQNFSGIELYGYDVNQLAEPIKAIKDYTQELDKYRILLNLPSISSTMTSRTIELLGSGGLVLHYDVAGEKCKQLFQDWQHMVYYDPSNEEELIEKIKYFLHNPSVAERIAQKGYELCHQQHTLESRIKTILDWVACEFDPNFCCNNFRKDRLEIDQNKLIKLNSDTNSNLEPQPKNKFKVSAIVSTYNSEAFIRGCLQDLVEQTLYQKNELEIIVIDSSSQQNEQKIVEEFQSTYPNIIYKRTLEREPLYTAWNRAIKMARGVYITNANTDDRHRFDSLDIMASYLDIHPEISLVYSDQLITTTANDSFLTTQADRRWGWPPYSYEQMTLGCCIGSQPMWRKSLHDKYGYFREEFKCAGDYEFWLRIGRQGECMMLIPEILGLYYFNPQGLEHGAPGRAGEECNLICDEYNIPHLYIPKKSGSERRFSDLQYQGVILTKEEKDYLALIQEKQKKVFPKIVIDGVFFQLNNTGIARVWQTLLTEWIDSGFSRHIVVLDRKNTAPRIHGLKYRNIESYDTGKTGIDSQMLQFVCDEVEADLFISTYYTTPLSTPAVFLAHDMIPEIIGTDLTDPIWQEKHYSILYSCRYIAVSQNTALDLVKFYPSISKDSITIAYNGISNSFFPADRCEIINFRTKYDIQKPYFLLIGSRLSLDNYKNGTLFFEALNQFSQRDEVAVVCVGGDSTLETELADLTEEIPVYLLRLDDEELRTAYSDAIALVYPSRYEGFGLPIVEAMACGCPVITCHNSSIPEVAGEAAIYVDEYKVEEMVDALNKVQIPEVRQILIERGFEQVKQFSWTRMAEIIANVLTTTVDQLKDTKINQLPLNWQEFRKMQAQLQSAQIEDKSLQKTFDLLEIELKQKQKELEDSETTLLAMQSSKFWKLRLAWFRLKPLLFPLISLILGLLLFALSNFDYTSYPLVQLFSWLSQIRDNPSFILGINLISIALMLGIVGYLNVLNAKALRLLRILLLGGGLILFLLSRF